MKKRIYCITMALCIILCIVFTAGCSKAANSSAALPEVRNNGTAIQWKYSDETDWRDLVLLTELTGAAGENGKDGANGTNGKDGINGTDGKNGIDGKNGKDGKDGADGKNGINGTNGKDGINGVDGKDGADGKDGINGTDGINGKSIEVQRAETHIQWRYEGGEWQNLVAIADIEGPAGQNGADGANGKTPEFRVNENTLQWRYVGDEIWLNLYDLTALKGADGRDGADGKNGKDGTNGINGSDGKDGKTPFIGENGNWWIGEIDTGIKAAGTDGKDGINGIDGTNGKEIEIQKTDLYIQWRYKGGEWQNLVALADIAGPSGQSGTNGENGKTPEFRVNGNQLQWRYTGDTTWLNLYDLSALKGADGKNGANGKNGVDGKDGKDGICAGYFAANGSVYSAGKALPFSVKKKSGELISYNASSNKITLSKGHTYSLVFSGTIAVSAKSDGKACGAALFDGYNSEMALETQTYVTAPKADQTEKLTTAYNTIYTAEEDITLTFQYTTMLLQDTNFKDGRYSITIIALD